jgi:hypothetical protein
VECPLQPHARGGGRGGGCVAHSLKGSARAAAAARFFAASGVGVAAHRARVPALLLVQVARVAWQQHAAVAGLLRREGERERAGCCGG